MIKRRSFLKAAGGAVVLSAAPGVAFGSAVDGRRVYVVVLDGLRPDEVSTSLTPNLVALQSEGTYFPRARSLPIMETIPNHVMMMTGVRPDRSGVPANSIHDRLQGAVRTVDRATDLRFPTLLERLPSSGLRTASVLSKEYLYGVFGTRASYRWEPKPVLPITGHAPDAFTSHALHATIDEADPDLVFVNFGDCDRVGHSDVTQGVARVVAVGSADQQLGKLVGHLKETGRWERSVVIVLADHSMDWSFPWAMVSLQGHLDADPLLRGKVVIAQNGGADLLYWTGPSSDRALAVEHLRSVVSRVSGVLSVHAPSELRLGPEAGDLVAFCQAGWRFADPTPVSNPIPGNHGHPATAPIPLVIGGGDPVVRGGASSFAASTVDVAPTVGKLFGLPDPAGGYDGQPLI